MSKGKDDQAQNNKQIIPLLKQIVALLEEINKWTRFIGMKEVKEVLDSVLDTDQKKLVYQLSDGSRGVREVCKAAGISSTGTISKYWREWTKLGLGESLNVKGGERFKRAFDLEDFGIKIPEIKIELEKKEIETPEKASEGKT